MQDRELLELAAKAAGWPNVEFQDMSGWGEVRYGLSQALWVPELGDYWNPLVNDGQAFRLAVKLGLLFGPSVPHFLSLDRLAQQDHDDFYSHRRAIVRAAADVGMAMP